VKPLVGITIGNPIGKSNDFYSLRDDYVRSVEKAGGLPVVLVPGRPEDAAALLDHLSALVLTGGADIDPALYGASRHPSVTRVFPERDAFEIGLTREALRRDLPLLAICRGQQVLNVATGGTLVQDIASEVTEACDHDRDMERWHASHDVEIVAGTKLRELLGADRVAVNSFHHQSVRKLGEGLVISASSPQDNIVEGVEAPDRRFVVGVQWHPEAFWDHAPGFDALFAGLVREASR
jgi:putative glutamine amidotransferase